MSSSPQKTRPFPSGNKLTEDRARQNYFEHHYSRIHHVTKGFDDTAPPRMDFTFREKHHKEIMAETQKSGLENLSLLDRLHRVFDYNTAAKTSPLPYRSSLQYSPGLRIDEYSYPRVDCVNTRMGQLESQDRGRSYQRERAMKRVVEDNNMLVGKLVSTRSDYERGGLEKSFLQSRKYLENARKVRSPSPALKALKHAHAKHFMTMSLRPSADPTILSPKSTMRSQFGATSASSPDDFSPGRSTHFGPRDQHGADGTPSPAPWDPSTHPRRGDGRIDLSNGGAVLALMQSRGDLTSPASRVSVSPSRAALSTFAKDGGSAGPNGRRLLIPEAYAGYSYPGSEILRNALDQAQAAAAASPRVAGEGSDEISPRRIQFSPGRGAAGAPQGSHRVPVLGSPHGKRNGGIASLLYSSAPERQPGSGGHGGGHCGAARSRPDSRDGAKFNDQHQMSIAGDTSRPESALNTYAEINGSPSAAPSTSDIPPAVPEGSDGSEGPGADEA